MIGLSRTRTCHFALMISIYRRAETRILERLRNTRGPAVIQADNGRELILIREKGSKPPSRRSPSMYDDPSFNGRRSWAWRMTTVSQSHDWALDTARNIVQCFASSRGVGIS